MAITQNTFTGDGSTTAYSFTFEYLETTDIKVSLDSVDTTAYTLSNATTITFTTAPNNGAAIRIYRDTDTDNLKATFNPGSAIRSSDLNDNFTQNLYVTQEAKFDVETANTTAKSAVTTADAATATANAATTTANNAVSTANTASTTASAAVATANAANATSNTAAADAASAVTTANTANTTAGNAVTTANSAVTTANSAVSSAATANTKADNAIASAATANTTAGNAVTAANAAQATANSATSTANTASTTAGNAVTTANSAVTTANAANTTANTANTNATTAVNTANAASAAVSSAAFYTPIAALANLPGSPANEDRVEVVNSTGVESSSDVTGVPTGFTGSTDLTIRLQYSSSSAKWEWRQYFAADPEGRYLTNYTPVVKGDGTSSGQVGKITLNCSNNNHGVSIQSPPHSAGATYTLTLPDDIGTAGQVLQTDGTSGNLSWNTPDKITFGTTGEVKLQNSSNNTDELLTTLESQLVRRDLPTHSFIYSPQYYSDNIELRGDKTFAFQVNTGGGGPFTSFKKNQSATTSVTFTLPDADGTAGQAIVTNGSGTLSFSNVDTALIETPQTISTNRVIAANTNAGMMGPTVAINSGVTISVGANSQLTVLN